MASATICMPPETSTNVINYATHRFSWNGYALALGLHDHMGPDADMINVMSTSSLEINLA